MNIADELQCLFHAEVEERDGSYVVEIPDRELSVGTLRTGQNYRVALLPATAGADSSAAESEPAVAAAPEPEAEPEPEPSDSTDASMTNGDGHDESTDDSNDDTAATADRQSRSSSQHQRANSAAPPVRVGDERVVDIEDIGDQGDGIARVDQGYVVIVPDAEKGERVTIEITDVSESVGFAKVVSRAAYYE